MTRSAPSSTSIDLERFGTSDQIEKQKVIARRELYWPLLIGVAGIAAWEVGAGVTALVQTRRRRMARP